MITNLNFKLLWTFNCLLSIVKCTIIILSLFLILQFFYVFTETIMKYNMYIIIIIIYQLFIIDK